MLFYAVESTLDDSTVTADAAVCQPAACLLPHAVPLVAIARCSLTDAPVSAQYPRSNHPLLSSCGCTASSNR